ncbi:GNAT family N-acetyltransferase [Propionimicrobium sp. PCR01-08-3]|uniref:GNAT family N-acetyltransferase n=1 Tax=Propionimicrobium sp. PCR01-08-3 TaxID=3052086 RepID=UPI00255CEF40|nr:GNAT family N-acetyltransferase [Propionimicrobium sp. PCR01-08-3]WIY82467.1 GNAT family N-acetyltransferase [Propionimicrobium sp. PCR01-08-3]
MNTTSIRITATTDVEALIVPHRASMKVAYAGYFCTPFPADDTLRDEWRVLHESGATTLLATIDGRPAGVLAWRVADGEGWLHRLYVHPDFQGQGVGRALHDRALASLRELGCTRANLWVLAVNKPAVELYEHWGWRQIPERPHSPFGLDEWHFSYDLGPQS